MTYEYPIALTMVNISPWGKKHTIWLNICVVSFATKIKYWPSSPNRRDLQFKEAGDECASFIFSLDKMKTIWLYYWNQHEIKCCSYPHKSQENSIWGWGEDCKEVMAKQPLSGWIYQECTYLHEMTEMALKKPNASKIKFGKQLLSWEEHHLINKTWALCKIQLKRISWAYHAVNYIGQFDLAIIFSNTCRYY